MKRAGWILFLVILVVCAFLLSMVEFQLARTERKENVGTSAATSQNPNAPEIGDPDRIYLHLENRAGLNSVLGWESRKQLESAGYTHVVLLNGAPGPDDFPLLMVGVRDQNTYWTPVSAGGTLRILAKYANFTSSVSLDSDASTTFDGSASQGRMPMRISIDSEISTSSRGLISLPKHRRILVSETASTIVETIQKALEEQKKKLAETSVQ